jgi:hypothetical protein
MRPLLDSYYKLSKVHNFIYLHRMHKFNLLSQLSGFMCLVFGSNPELRSL